MITRKFIEKIHDAFDELNYHETEQVDFDEFYKSFVQTLTHCQDYVDAINAIQMYQFCAQKWRKIEKIFDKKVAIFNEYSFEGRSLISAVSDNDAYGSYFITNGLSRKDNEITVASYSIDEGMFDVEFRRDKFFIFDDGDYYLTYSKRSSNMMKLFNKQNKCLCNIVLNDEANIILEDNATPYELVTYDNFIGIYNRDYYESLSANDIIDTDKLVADIEWDLIDDKTDLGMAQLRLYEDADLEMLLYFTMSTFLEFHRYMKWLDEEYIRQKKGEQRRNNMLMGAIYWNSRH